MLKYSREFIASAKRTPHRLRDDDKLERRGAAASAHPNQLYIRLLLSLSSSVQLLNVSLLCDDIHFIIAHIHKNRSATGSPRSLPCCCYPFNHRSDRPTLTIVILGPVQSDAPNCEGLCLLGSITVKERDRSPIDNPQIRTAKRSKTKTISKFWWENLQKFKRS